MIYKRGNRYQLKRGAVAKLIEETNSLGIEHEKLKHEGFKLPRITIIVARSGLATIRATWSKRMEKLTISHRLVVRGVPLA